MNCSKVILIIVVYKAASNIQIIHHNIHKNISAKIIVTGCRSRAEPITFGSIKSPIIILAVVGIRIINRIGVSVSYCIKATGIGKTTAIMAPNIGINVRKNVFVCS